MPSRRRIGIAAILITVIIVAAMLIYSFSHQPSVNPFTDNGHTPLNTQAATVNPDTTPVSSVIPPYECSFTALNPQNAQVPGYSGFYNVSQGSRLQMNVTFTSVSNQLVTISIENLTVTYFTSTVNLHSVTSGEGNYSILQQSAFTCSFSPNQLTIQPYASNSTLLSINLTQNAPTGQYTIDMNLGQVGGVTGTSYAQTIGFPELIVTTIAT